MLGSVLLLHWDRNDNNNDADDLVIIEDVSCVREIQESSILKELGTFYSYLSKENNFVTLYIVLANWFHLRQVQYCRF